MKTRTIVLLILLLGLAACAGLWEEDDIAVSEVPRTVLDAARGAVDGLEIRSAEAEQKNGRTVYEINGSANGQKYEVKVTADGEVLKVESDD